MKSLFTGESRGTQTDQDEEELLPVEEEVVVEDTAWAPPSLALGSDLLTLAQVQGAVPQHMKTVITDSLIDKINNCVRDPIVAEDIRKNFIGYARILGEGKFKVEDYLNAVKYASYKVMNYTNKDAYEATFPDRVATMRASGKDDKTISAYVAAYHKGKLVNLIMEQTLVPFHVLNQDIRQKAVNELSRILTSSLSDKVRVEAASALLSHLAPPKESNINLKINTTDSQEVRSLRDELRQLAELQRAGIVDGSLSTKAVAASKLIRDDAEEV